MDGWTDGWITWKLMVMGTGRAELAPPHCATTAAMLFLQIQKRGVAARAWAREVFRAGLLRIAISGNQRPSDQVQLLLPADDKAEGTPSLGLSVP